MERSYRGNEMNFRSRNCTRDGEALMRKIAETDFALYETILYLDAYPESKEALAYYRALNDTRKALMAEYENQFGPLTAFGNTDPCSWNWTKTPWPWQ